MRLNNQKNYDHADRSSSGRCARSASTPPKPRGRDFPGEVDRYNYVDRDIYSSSTGRRSPKRRKGGKAKKIFAVIFVLFLAIAGFGYLYFRVMASRLNRTENVDSARAEYVETPSAAPVWDVASDGDVMNILLLGIDENEDASDGRSDSNILVSVNQKTKTIRLVSFLRDSYLSIPTVGMDKLNAAYSAGGVALTMQTLENNFRVSIKRYMSVNFQNFADVVDRLGGLDVQMSKETCDECNTHIGTDLTAGLNHLNGTECLYYARIRHATDEYGHDDYGRAARQRQIIQLLIGKMKSMNPVEASKVMYDFLPYLKTNLTDSEIACLGGVAATLSGYKVESLQIPVDGTFDDQSSIPGVGTVVDMDLTQNSQALRDFLYDGTSTSAPTKSGN